MSQLRPDGTRGYYKHACAASATAGIASCNLVRETDAQGDNLVRAARADGTPDGLHPDEVARAYAIPTWGGLGRTVAIVDPFDNRNAEADLQVYRAQFGLPPCTTANGCFRKVNQNGNTTPLPTGNASWGVEIALDLDAVTAACPSCKILLVEANDNSLTNLEQAERTAANLGAAVITNSWGLGEFNGEAADSTAWNFPGIGVFFSTGDSGFGVEYPAASQYVTAVGGTSLTASTTAARGWRETAWSGAGSGCSQYIAKPSWQHDGGCSNRSVADVSAVADPFTGLAVYDTYQEAGWLVAGGTSLAAPLVAAIYASAGTGGAGPSLSYGGADAFFDVTTGSNGSCGSYLCTAGIGYDGPTGNGSPAGTLLVNPPDPTKVVGGGVTGDFDGDGKADVMVLYDNGNASAGLWVFPGTTGQGDGATAPYRVWFAPGPNAFDATRAKVSAGDFDGDGKTDVLVLYDYGGNSAGLFVFPGASGHFEGATQPYRVWFAPGPNAFDVSRAKVSAGDFNGDGKVDLLALYDYGGSSAGLFVFPGASGHFEGASQLYRVWFVPGPNAFDVSRAKVSAGDFDGDGKADLLALYDYGNSSAGLIVFPGATGRSDGSTFPSRVWFAPGPNAFDVGRAKVSAGDFDGNGKADLLALYDYGNSSAGLIVFPGTTGRSDGSTFPSRVWFTPGPNAFDVSRAKVTAGDFDHNGKQDVMALYDYGSGSAGLWVFPGTTGHTDGSTSPFRVWNSGPGSFDLRLSRVP
ncbi:MAG TPA: FG-GAP-like repeat-containing protein [Kofleriaceae bacterium]